MDQSNGLIQRQWMAVELERRGQSSERFALDPCLLADGKLSRKNDVKVGHPLKQLWMDRHKILNP